MENEKSFGGTLALVAAGVVLLALVNNKFSGDPQPQPSVSSTPMPPRAAEPSPPDYWLKNRAEREVRKMLKDPDSAVFTELTVHRSPALVVCGNVNSRNGFGGMTGRQEFISGTLTVMREQMDDAEFIKTWEKVC